MASQLQKLTMGSAEEDEKKQLQKLTIGSEGEDDKNKKKKRRKRGRGGICPPPPLRSQSAGAVAISPTPMPPHHPSHSQQSFCLFTDSLLSDSEEWYEWITLNLDDDNDYYHDPHHDDEQDEKKKKKKKKNPSSLNKCSQIQITPPSGQVCSLNKCSRNSSSSSNNKCPRIPPLRSFTTICKIEKKFEGSISVALGSSIYRIGGALIEYKRGQPIYLPIRHMYLEENQPTLQIFSREVFCFDSTTTTSSTGVESADDGAGWKRVSPMINARAGGRALAIQGKLYVLGGNPGLFSDDDDDGSWGEIYDPISDLWTPMADPPLTLPNGFFKASVCTDRADADSVSILLVFEHLKTILSYFVKTNVWEQVSYGTAAPCWSRISLEGFARVLVGTTLYWIQSHRNRNRDWEPPHLDNFHAGCLLYDPTGGFTRDCAYDFEDNTLFTGLVDDFKMEMQLDKDAFDGPYIRHLVGSTFLMLWTLKVGDKFLLHCTKFRVHKKGSDIPDNLGRNHRKLRVTISSCHIYPLDHLFNDIMGAFLLQT